MHLTKPVESLKKQCMRSKKLMPFAFFAITVSWNYQLVNKNISL